MTVYALKPAFQKSLSPLLAGLHRSGVTPNQLTLATCFACVLYAGICLLWPPALIVFPVVAFLRMALNALDGMLASRFDMRTRRGAFLNEVTDVVADVAMMIPFAVVPWVSVLIVMTVVCEFVGLSALAAGVERRFQGPFGKSDRAVYFSIFAILLVTGISTSAFLGVGIALALLTVVNRARSIWRAV